MNKKSNTGWVVYLILSLLIICGLIFYICYDKGIIFKTNSDDSNIEDKTDVNNDNEKDQEAEKNDGNAEEKTQGSIPKCYGTYYGEYSETQSNGLTSNYEYTYILNQDGTFTADFGGVSGSSGFYYINDNTISLIGTKDTVGPRDQDPRYATVDYVIADDCSYILYNDGRGISFKINKQ